MSSNPQSRARLPGTQQYKTRSTIFRKISQRIGLVHFSFALQSARAGQAVSLMAQRWQNHTLGESCVPNVFVAPDLDRAVSIGKQQSYSEHLRSRVHKPKGSPAWLESQAGPYKN